MSSKQMPFESSHLPAEVKEGAVTCLHFPSASLCLLGVLPADWKILIEYAYKAHCLLQQRDEASTIT